MFYKLNLSIHRKPISMNIEKAHKNGYHYSTIVKIPVLFHFFNDNDFTVGRCYYDIFCLAVKIAFGTAKEVKQDGIEYC